MAFHEPFIRLEEGSGGEREESQWVYKMTFFLIIEVFGAIHTGYS